MDKKWEALLSIDRIRVIFSTDNMIEIELWDGYKKPDFLSEEEWVKDRKENREKLSNFAKSWEEFTSGKIQLRGSAGVGSERDQHIGFRVDKDKESKGIPESLNLFIETLVRKSN